MIHVVVNIFETWSENELKAARRPSSMPWLAGTQHPAQPGRQAAHSHMHAVIKKRGEERGKIARTRRKAGCSLIPIIPVEARSTKNTASPAR